jgi:hypothetical protein
MIIGKVSKDEKKIKFNLNLKCSKCGKKVPGGISRPSSSKRGLSRSNSMLAETR